MFGWKSRRMRLLQEFEHHIELETQENIEAGMSAAEARRAARVKFGSVMFAAEQSRTVWGGVWLERIVQDVRYAVRSLRGAPGYTAVLMCTLALGLGSVTAMLAIIESILIRPVALPHSEQLVQMYGEDGPSGTSASPHALSYKAINELQRSTHSFAGISGYNTMVRPVAAADGTRITVLTEVLPEFFPMLGVQVKYGRLIGPSDVNAHTVVVSDEFWHERLSADPHAVGSTIKVSGQPSTIVGVLAPGVHFPMGTGGPVVYLPVSFKSSGEDDYMIESAAVIARLKPGFSKQQALADAQSVFAHADRMSGEQSRHLVLRSYRDTLVGDLAKPLWTLLGGVAVLLLIACANAANLQIGRASSRLAEMTTRSALGASFGRLLQQMITESVLVSLLGAALGGVLSYAAIRLVRYSYGNQFPRFDELSLGPLVFGLTCVLAVLVGVLASIAPILNIRRRTTVRVNAHSVTRKSRLPGTLVAFQVALTCVLLVISGLFVRTLQSLENVPLGFDPHDVTTLVLMPEQQNQDPERSRELETNLLHRFETLPGVQAVTMQTEVPFSNYNMTLNGSTNVSGRAFQAGDAAFYSMVSMDFVKTSGIRLLKGRTFEPGDEASSAIAVLANEAFLKKYLDGRDPIGAEVRFHRNQGDTDADLPFTQPMTIVGVVENEVQGNDLEAKYQPMIYIDYLQLPRGSLLGQVFSMTAQYAIRSNRSHQALASELRRVVSKEAPSFVEMSLQSMEEGIDQSLGQKRLALRLVSGFGVLALVLSVVGIYGVLAYSVALRRREIGIRIALGSTRSKAAGLIMRQAAAMAFLGLLPGIAGAWAAGYAIRSYLYGVKTFDPAAVGVAAFILMLAFAAAGSLPAMRAARVDPAETLRAE